MIWPVWKSDENLARFLNLGAQKLLMPEQNGEEWHWEEACEQEKCVPRRSSRPLPGHDGQQPDPLPPAAVHGYPVAAAVAARGHGGLRILRLRHGHRFPLHEADRSTKARDHNHFGFVEKSIE